MTIIAGNAFNDDHEEIVRAHELGLTVTRYHDFLGNFMGQYTSVAVTGSHGKTSTTGLLSHVMNGDKKTSYLILVMVQGWGCLVVSILHLKPANIADIS